MSIPRPAADHFAAPMELVRSGQLTKHQIEEYARQMLAELAAGRAHRLRSPDDRRDGEPVRLGKSTRAPTVRDRSPGVA